MNRYKITVDTSAFNPFYATKNNWENGTKNDFMYAINGWHITETSLCDLKNRLKLMVGYGADDKYYQEKYAKWMSKSFITYRDRMCGFKRKQIVGVYGIAQGYIDIESHIEEMRKTGKSKIYFSDAYDIRQYSKNYDGCYIEIAKNTAAL